jgi:ribosomal protein S8
MPNTTSQIFKRIVFTVGSLILLGIILSIVNEYYHARKICEKSIHDRLVAIVSTAVLQIDGDDFDLLRDKKDFSSDKYLKIAHILQDIRNANKLEKDAIKTLRREGNITNFVVTSNNQNVINQEFDLWREMNPTFNKGEVEVKLSYDKNNREYASAFAPIKNTNSEIVGLLQVDMSVDDSYPFPTDYIILPLILGTILLIISIIVIRLILRPLQYSIDAKKT